MGVVGLSGLGLACCGLSLPPSCLNCASHQVQNRRRRRAAEFYLFEFLGGFVLVQEGLMVASPSFGGYCFLPGDHEGTGFWFGFPTSAGFLLVLGYIPSCYDVTVLFIALDQDPEPMAVQYISGSPGSI